MNPAQEPQEPVEPQIPAVSQSVPQESKVEDVAGENKDQAGKSLPVSLVSCYKRYWCMMRSWLMYLGNKPVHHHNWGWLRRASEEEREKRRLSQQEKERADWAASKKDDDAQRSSQGAGVGFEGGRQG